jgi:hypothetical protein
MHETIQSIRHIVEHAERPRHPFLSYCEFLLDRHDKLEAEISRINHKLDDGTLHVGYCNGDHEKRVGSPDTTCNCTLGREIKTLRHEREKFQIEVEAARDLVDAARRVYNYYSGLVMARPTREEADLIDWLGACVRTAEAYK